MQTAAAVRAGLKNKIEVGKEKMKDAQEKLDGDKKTCREKMTANCKKCTADVRKVCVANKAICKEGCNIAFGIAKVGCKAACYARYWPWQKSKRNRCKDRWELRALFCDDS